YVVKCDCRSRSGIPAEKTRAWCKIRPLGCRDLRAPTWRKSNEPLCRPPAPAGSANRRVDQFHPSSCTAVSIVVQCRPKILAVSPSDRGRSDYQYLFHLIIARPVLSEIRAGQSEAS